MKEVIKLIEKESREKCIDRHQGLNVLLDFLIDIFDIKHYTSKGGWGEYVSKAERENKNLFTIMMIWMNKVADAMERGEWIDFFGGIYEEVFQSKSKASTLGQFYTPSSVCDLMARISVPNEGRINDCACGSGRTLLASHAKSNFSTTNFI